jgi:hypothetical protein
MGRRGRWVAIGSIGSLLVFGAGGAAAVNSTPSDFRAVTPVRVFDTRNGTGAVPVGPVGPASTLEVVIGGTNGIPLSATGVSLNVTVVGGTTSSFLTVWPMGDPKPNASNLNWTGSAATPNAVTVGLGTAGKVSFYNDAGSVHVLADVVGYYTAAVPGPPGPQGPAGPQGQQGPQGTSGIVATHHFSGAIPTIPAGRSTFKFLGQAAPVMTADGQRLTSTASGVIGATTAGNPSTDLAICFQAFLGGGDPHFMNTYLTFNLVSGLRQMVSATGSGVLGAGTWRIGLCGRSDAPLDLNDFVSGWVQVTN